MRDEQPTVLRRVARSVIAGVGTAGALALLNRGLAAGLPVNHLDGMQRRWTWRDREIFAVQGGDGPCVLLLHAPGLFGSSYEYRKLFALLARRHRVVAFDFLGCGLSDKPNVDYTADLFLEQTLDAVETFSEGSAGCVVVGSSLSAAYAMRAAARAGERLRGVVAINPSPAAQTSGLSAVLRMPVVGESAYNALVSKRSLRNVLSSVYYAHPSSVTDDVVDALYAISHQPGSRYVAAAYLSGNLDCDAARDLPFVDVPLLVLWGKRSKTNPARNAVEYVSLAKRAEVTYFVRSSLLPHDEEADAVASRIEEYVRSLHL